MSRSTAKLQGLRIDDVVHGIAGASGSRPVERSVGLHLVPTFPIGRGDFAAEIQFPADGLVNVVWRLELVDGSERFLELPRIGRNHHAGVFSLSSSLKAITLEVAGSGDPLGYMKISLRPLNPGRRVLLLTRRAIKLVSRELYQRFWPHPQGQESDDDKRSQADYAVWQERFDERPDRDRDIHINRAAGIAQRPLISLLMRASSDADLCLATIASVRAQIYAHWELIVRAHPNAVASIESLLKTFPSDSRVTVRPEPEDCAEAYNDGLAVAEGSFTGIVPPGARLPAHALTEIALAIESRPELELLYTDEDKIGPHGRRFAPLFKPDWSPDFLRSNDYLGHLTFYRTSTLRRLGGWRSLADEENFDAKLRVLDAVSSAPGAVLHLAKVLVHLPDRSDAKSSAVERAGWSVPDPPTSHGPEAVLDSSSSQTRLGPLSPPLVSIIIPTRDQATVLRSCVRSILERTDYHAYEIVIVDNGSKETETIRLFNELSRDQRVTILKYSHPFNYSAINNFAVRHARGSLLAFLNNDVEVVAADWLSEMAAYAIRPELGCVGAKLLYPDGTVQHGGILLGVAGLAGHAHRHAPATAPGYLARLQSVVNVSAVTGACLVMRRGVFEEVGGFDEVGLATAFNDVDLCLKARAAGYMNLWTPHAVLIHHESKSRGYERTPAKRARLAAEEDVMRRRWGRALLEDPYYSPHLTRLGEDFRVRRF